VIVDYPAVEAIRRLTAVFEGSVTSESFGEGAVFTIEIPVELLEKFEQDLQEATNGKAKLKRRTAGRRVE
jgi:putative IMPACT (imprinted ancient) family translation regulator